MIGAGMDTQVRKPHSRRSWDEWYADAKACHEREGRLLIPKDFHTGEGFPLGRWLSTQRELYKGKAGQPPERLVSGLKQDHRCRWKKSAGFTLVEVLVLLVIAVIVAAFAVPGITGYLDNVRKTRQEETVRLLYSAAQNKLTYLSANDPDGKYTEFRAPFEEDTIFVGKTVEGSGTGTKDAPVELDVVRQIIGELGDGLGAPVDEEGGVLEENSSARVACYSALYQTRDSDSNGAKAVYALLGESGLYNVIEKGDCRIELDPSLRFILRVSLSECVPQLPQHL